MGNLMVAVLGTPNYTSSIAKKGTSTDITLFNLKKSEDTVTFVEPTRFPERLEPLFYAASAAKAAIVVVDELNAFFGECLVMLHCCGVKSGYFILRNYVAREKIEPLIKGTALERYEFVEDNPVLLRDKLLALTAEEKSVEGQVGGAVSVDHAFNVKGVGAVALGVVKSGSIEKHAALSVLPAAKSAQVRSVPKHEDEFGLAGGGGG